MKKTMGEIISESRKSKGMTQLELADKMGITDKAVSKWERNLSCPDISSLPQLAEILGISIEELIQSKDSKPKFDHSKFDAIIDAILKGIGAAMGISVTVLTILNALEPSSAIILLGIGLACISISQFEKKKEE